MTGAPVLPVLLTAEDDDYFMIMQEAFQALETIKADRPFHHIPGDMTIFHLTLPSTTPSNR